MIYLDTSAAVPLFVPEPASERIATWFAACADPVVAADWIVPEFASALALKARRGEITTEDARVLWSEFERFRGAGLRLIPVTRMAFADAARMVCEAASGLRAGDSLHLAVALEVGATHLATVDATLAANAKRRGLPTIEF